MPFQARRFPSIPSASCRTEKEFILRIALIIEGFESGTLSEGWTNDATFPWTFSTDDPYEGNYCMKSAAIPGQRHTDLILNHEAAVDDSISFYFKVSTEEYDVLHFYIDDEEKGTWSGIKDWSRASFPVLAGNHDYKWSYAKDFTQSAGEDCVWIDFITLPFLEDVADIDETIEDNNVKVYPNPSTGFITVKANDLRHIAINNAIGQIVYESNAADSEQSLQIICAVFASCFLPWPE